MITDSVKKIASILKTGGIVIFPTETVYGIGALARNKESCLRIYTIKQRPADNPLIVHFSNQEQIEKYCFVPDIARLLWKEFSPGPLTLILKAKDDSLFSCGLDTIAVRIPKHAKLLELLSIVGPIAAPSANPSGKPSYTRMEDIVRDFATKVDGILQAEPQPEYGLESTVLDLSSGKIILLRTGSIDRRTIESKLGISIERSQSPEILSPGMKYRHYSPNGRVIICKILPTNLNPRSELSFRHQENSNTIKLKSKVARIGFSIPDLKPWDRLVNNNKEYARKLYEFLIDCDIAHIETIYCQEPLNEELADTILDRLTKASHK